MANGEYFQFDDDDMMNGLTINTNIIGQLMTQSPMYCTRDNAVLCYVQKAQLSFIADIYARGIMRVACKINPAGIRCVR